MHLKQMATAMTVIAVLSGGILDGAVALPIPSENGANLAGSQVIDALEQQRISLAQEEARLDELKQQLSTVRSGADRATLATILGTLLIVGAPTMPAPWMATTSRIIGLVNVTIGVPAEVILWAKEKVALTIDAQRQIVLEKKQQLARMESMLMQHD